MKSQRLQPVMEWLKATDLATVSYNDGSFGFELTTCPVPAAPPPGLPASRFIPVCALAVGLFQSNAPGQPKLGDEGLSVKEGDALGQIETGAGQPHVVRSPSAGRVARVFVSCGQAVQYGQPLFFLER